MAIRRMEERDVDRVMAIAGGLAEAPRWDRGVYLGALAEAAGAVRRIALVAVWDEGKALGAGVVGFAVASVVGDSAELELIAVEGEAQGRGVGGALLAEVVAETQRDGAGEVLLEVREGNLRARKLYEKAGFFEVGRRRGYYSRPVEDAVLLRLKFE